MEIERRAFIKLAGAAALTLCGPTIPRAQTSDGATRYVSACMLGDGSFAVVEFDPEGMILRTIPLPNRGHGLAMTSDRRVAVAFSRHPYTFGVAFEVGGNAPPTVFACPADRHFYGHGAFADGDRLLLATENDYEDGRGVIGVYDVAAGFARIGEFDSHGIGPHEMVVLADGRTAAIANGGIDTHPMTGDARLNLATMDSSLVFLDTANGDVLAEHRLEPSLYQLSMRHLAVDAMGSVWFGCQYVGAETDQPPLIGRAGPDVAPVLIAGPPQTRASLRNYVGAVATTMDGNVIAISAPRGGQLLFLDLDGNVLGTAPLQDGCGIAPLEGGRVIASAGTGALVAAGPGSRLDAIAQYDLAFDAHILAARAP